MISDSMKMCDVVFSIRTLVSGRYPGETVPRTGCYGGSVV
jgi:hypothetical protein